MRAAPGTMGRTLLAGALACACACSLLAGGCGSRAAGGQGGGPSGLKELEGGVELGLRRGSAWSTLTVRPPHVIGPRVNLEIRKGVIAGSIDGRGANLKLDGTSIHGTGPMGSVAVEIADAADKTEIDGTWNGSRVHFTVSPESLKGTISIYQGRRFDQVFRCQYVLDRVEQDGARTGTSICNGLPEETRIEVPAKVQAWLTRTELVVVLLALLSSPPYTSFETM